MRTLPGRADRVRGGHGGHDLVRRQAVGAQPLGIDPHDHAALAGPEGRGSRDARQGREEGTDPVQGQVLDLPHGPGVAGEDQVADGDAARVEAHDEGRHGPRRHEGPGPVGVVDGLRHRLGHVGPRMELQLDERHPLDRLGLHVLDAGHVEEVVLVVVGQEPFHLGGIHPSVGLGDVEDRDAEVREDVAGHHAQRGDTGQDDGDHGDDDRQGPPHRGPRQAHWLLRERAMKRARMGAAPSPSGERGPE